MATRWGATAEEWAHFSLVLGLTEDLLPVVSNPNIPILPNSTLASREHSSIGKVPSKLYDGRIGGIKNWTALRSTPAQVAAWSRQESYGICLQTRTVRGLDIDVEDPNEVQTILAFIEAHCGVLPQRTRPNSARVLCCLEVAGPLERATVARGAGIVELLADGQQFIAAGTHPSGARYAWRGGLPVAIPVIDRRVFDALWADLGGGQSKRRRVATPRDPDAGPAVGAGAQDDAILAHLEARGWVREWPRRLEDGVPIICPWDIDHTADTGPTATVYFPAGTGGYVHGHFRCLHAHCAARGDDEFLDAVGFEVAAGEFEALPAKTTSKTDRAEDQNAPPPRGLSGGGSSVAGPPAVWSSAPPGLSLRAVRGRFEASFENVCRALRTDGWGFELAYDEFVGNVVWRHWRAREREDGSEWQEVSDDLVNRYRILLEAARFQPVPKGIAFDAVQTVGREKSFNSAAVWLNSLKWDGIERIDGFLARYFGAAADSTYVRAVSAYLWTALAGRVLAPGVQADMMPILVSEREGRGKTRGLEALCPPGWYGTINFHHSDVDNLRKFRGKVVLEVGELQGFKSRELENLKAFITERVDEHIEKYREFATRRPRQCLMIGTTNRTDFLDGLADNRRFLPVWIEGVVVREDGALGVDLAALRADRDQLWAEAAVRFRAGGVEWAASQRAAPAAREEFEERDELLLADVERFLAIGEIPLADGFRLADVMRGCGFDSRNVKGGIDSKRIGRCLKFLGYRNVFRKINGRGERIWVKND